MRVVLAGDYPEHPPTVVGGIQAVIYNTVCRLGDYRDLDLHIVTCEKRGGLQPHGSQVVREKRWTVHYLPSSSRLPHSLTMLTLDRRAVRRQIKALAPDLVHAHGQAAAYPFAAFDTGVPTLVTVHGINMLEAKVDPRGGRIRGGLRVALWGAAERSCLRRARDIVVISPFVEETIRPYTSARLHVVENPVHEDLFNIRPSPIPGKVLLVGSVQRRKGILEAIQAMTLVRKQVPEAELYVAGAFSPAYRAYGDLVRRTVKDVGAESYVHFSGHMDHQALLDAYRTSQLFILPSHLEASPVVLAEAMTAGLPSVVSDIGSTGHLIQEGVTGCRVPPGDVQALARRIVQLLTDEMACTRMGLQASEIARTRFRPEVAAQKTHDLYLALAGTRR